MAAPATARRVDLHYHNSDRTPPSTRAAQQTALPRPSISPLSTHSKNLSSPELHQKDVPMAVTQVLEDAEVDNFGDALTPALNEPPDDRSSSLSEPEDESDDNENHGVTRHEPSRGTAIAQRLLEVDSEAETERLDQTPQKLQKHADILGRTPSKLSQAATVDEELSEPPSPLPVDAGAASSTSTVGRTGQKRKRSDTAESSLTSAESDLGESPRKRSHDSIADALAGVDEGIDEAELPGGTVETTEEAMGSEEANETAPVSTKGLKGRKGKQKGRKLKEAVTEAELETGEELGDAEEEPSEENVAKTEEDLKLRKDASSLYVAVTTQFRAFKEKLLDDRLAVFDTDLEMLSQRDSVHPEYLRQVASVDARLQKQSSEARAYYFYMKRSIRERTLGERSQLHSQYHQYIRDLREDILEKLGEDWYAIQNERRQGSQAKEDAAILEYQSKRSVQIRQQAKYNQELSVLSGVAKYVGFPAAPEIAGVEGDRFDQDLKAMKISKRIQQPAPAPPPVPAQPVYIPKRSTSFEESERLAHEQFIKQNPWAQTRAAVHHGTPGISHTPDWAEPSAGAHGSARNLMRTLSGHVQRNLTPFATPMPQRRGPLEHSSSGTVVMGSDGVDVVPSSVLAAPPTTDRLAMLGSREHSSPITVPKVRQNGSMLTGFRNISGISGTSTIDAPLEHDLEREPRQRSAAEIVSELPSVRKVLDARLPPRHPDGPPEMYASMGFRPQEGAFGTPAPLPTTTSGGS